MKATMPSLGGGMLLLTAILACFTLFTTLTTAAPVTDSSNLNFPTGSGVTQNGIYWHEHEATVTWPSGHSITVESNQTSNMPGWDSTWGPVGHSNVETVSAATDTAGVNGYVVNKCSYPVYVHTTNGGTDDPSVSTGTYPVAAGQTYETSLQVTINAGYGMSVKVATTDVIGSSNILQLEIAEKQDSTSALRVWYDMSNINGDPFANEARFIQAGTVAGVCPSIYNAPGSEANDYPIQGDCAPAVGVYLYLC